MARNYVRRHPAADLADTTSDAYLALTLAVRSFDPDRGGDLHGYVSWRMKLGIVDGLRERLGYVLSDPDKERLRRATRSPVARFEDPVANARNLTLADVLPETPLGDLTPHEHAEVRLDLETARGSLTDRERSLVADYFDSDLSLREIGAARGVTESAASLSVRKALTKLGRAYGGNPHPLLTRGGVQARPKEKTP